MNTRIPKMILLDREGVILQHVEPYILSKESIWLIDNSISSIKKILDRGILVSVVSNQSPISRRLITDEFVEETNAMIRKKVNHKDDLLRFYYCPHIDQDNCNCRKPKPGLLQRAMEECKLLPEECWMVGDADTDMLAGINANVSKKYHVLSGRQKESSIYADEVYADLATLVDRLL